LQEFLSGGRGTAPGPSSALPDSYLPQPLHRLNRPGLTSETQTWLGDVAVKSCRSRFGATGRSWSLPWSSRGISAASSIACLRHASVGQHDAGRTTRCGAAACGTRAERRRLRDSRRTRHGSARSVAGSRGPDRFPRDRATRRSRSARPAGPGTSGPPRTTPGGRERSRTSVLCVREVGRGFF